jgi:UV DNA damage repair endonuclease
MKNRIGYCCLSIGINENLKKKDHILVNRGMVRKTFDAKGLPYVADLIVENLKDTLKVLDYNIKNDIRVYRLSSDSFPWMSEYSFENLPRFAVINSFLKVIGKKIRENDMRVSYHPSPYCVLGSENPSVVQKTIDDLNKRSIGFKVLSGQGVSIDTTTSAGKMMFSIFGAFAEFERDLIEDLMQSASVYIQTPDNRLFQCHLAETELEIYKNINEQLFSYTFNVRVSNNEYRF